MQHLYAKEPRFVHKNVCLIRHLHGGVDGQAQLDSNQKNLQLMAKQHLFAVFNKNTGLICYDLRSF